MKRLLIFVAGGALVCAMAAAPVLADTGTSTTGIAHAIDCFGLLLTDPAKHAQECGGPTFAPAPAPNAGGDGNSGCPQKAEIQPFDPATGQQVQSDVDDLMATGPSIEPCAVD